MPGLRSSTPRAEHNMSKIQSKPLYTCQFCGGLSYVDPSDQSPPPDYCHESDHGEPEEIDSASLSDVVHRASSCHSGMIEYAIPSSDDDAVDVAQSVGFMEVIGNGVAMVTPAGREWASSQSHL